MTGGVCPMTGKGPVAFPARLRRFPTSFGVDRRDRRFLGQEGKTSSAGFIPPTSPAPPDPSKASGADVALGVVTLLAGAPDAEGHAAPPNRSDPLPGVDPEVSSLPGSSSGVIRWFGRRGFLEERT